MITKELIRAEIERRLKDYWKICFQDAKAYNEDSNVRELKELLSFLDTLPDESVTDCHDLKKHTKEWVELMVGASFPEQDGNFISEEDYRSVIKKTALHFAEWGAEHFRDTTKMTSKDLEEAAEEYADYNSRRWQEDGDIYYDHSKIKDAFIAGAEWQDKKWQDIIKTAEDHAFLAGADWQKEQMMENAVEGKVFMSFVPGHNQMVMADVDLPTNTKVKIIIVKEEEE